MPKKLRVDVESDEPVEEEKVEEPVEEEKVTIVDANDRTFTLESGAIVELKAGVPTEVAKEVADELVAKYPYLKTL